MPLGTQDICRELWLITHRPALVKGLWDIQLLWNNKMFRHTNEAIAHATESMPRSHSCSTLLTFKCYSLWILWDSSFHLIFHPDCSDLVPKTSCIFGTAPSLSSRIVAGVGSDAVNQLRNQHECPPTLRHRFCRGGEVIKMVFVPYSSRMCILKQHWVTPWNPFTPNLLQHEASTPLSSPLCSSLLISFSIRCVLFASGGFPQSNSQHHLVTGLGIPRRKLYCSLSNF